MEPGTVAEWVTVGIATAATLGVVWQLRQVNFARKHEYEDIYVQRYWQLMSELSAEERIALWRGDLPESATKDSRTRALLWSYLELCEDEADQREAGLITTVAWRLWREGIHGAATRPPFVNILAGFEGELAGITEADRPFAQLRKAASLELHTFDPRPKRRLDWFTG